MTTIKREWMIILAVWLLMFVYDPLYMFYAHFVSQFDFSWSRVFSLWGYTLAYLLLFLVHHYILLPCLVVKKRKSLYAVCVVACLIAFVVFLVVKMPMHDADHADTLSGHASSRPPLLAPPDLGRLLTAVLMLLTDLGAVAWISEQKLRAQVLLLEKQALKQELMQLHYQINPHFFMNTLNNIHALVDLDQERAKRAIVELSGMMRYSLYEGNDSLTPLAHEIEFLQLYISLMKLRFSEKVALRCDLPSNVPSDVMLPPLLLATFIENAFKYGISYQNPSYISVSLALEDNNNKIHFRCENSRHTTSSIHKDDHHGIGLANVRKRLELQFAECHSFVIDDHDPSCFIVDLVIPSKTL